MLWLCNWGSITYWEEGRGGGHKRKRSHSPLCDFQLSQYSSDVRRRHIRTSLEQFITASANINYSNYHSILYEFLRYFHSSQILLVKTEALTTSPQETVDYVRKHFGMKSRKINPFWGNKGQGTDGYTDPTKQIHEHTLKQITGWNIKFFNLVGVKFNWKMFV